MEKLYGAIKHEVQASVKSVWKRLKINDINARAALVLVGMIAAAEKRAVKQITLQHEKLE